MKVVRIENLSLEEKKVLMHLRNNVFPVQFGHAVFEEFDLYLDSLIEVKHYLLKDENQIGGWAFTFFRDHEVWFSIMINNQIQGKGNGTKLIEELKRNNFNLNGWVIDHENDIM
jgi:predicted GNAT family N-acyltransferase